jgi:hypothetical protein
MNFKKEIKVASGVSLYEASRDEMKKLRSLKKEAQSSHEITYQLVQKGQPF